MKKINYFKFIIVLFLVFVLGEICNFNSSQAALKVFSLNRTSVKIGVGKSYTLKTTYDNSGTKVIWKTSDDKVASVTKGVVNANSVGTATITASCGKESKSCKVTVYQQAKSIKLTTNSYIEVGDTFIVSKTISPENATFQKLSWSVDSEDWWPTVEYVSGNKFKAVEEGTATIIAYQKDTNKTYKLKVTVHEALGSFHIESDNEKVTALSTYPGYHLSVNTVLDDEYWDLELVNKFTYSISDPNIATVDENGQIKGIREGTAVLKVTAVNNKSVECKLQVLPLPEGATIDKFQLPEFIQVIGDGGYNWYSSEYNFASVDNTQIIPLSSGNFAIFNCTNTENNNLVIHYYEFNQEYKLQSNNRLELPFTQWGGVYLGNDGYYYIAVGQMNKEEDNSKTVYSIIKYNKELVETGRCNITGAECSTTVPFDAGNCSMDMNGTTLAVYTCRERYTSEDGKNHQSNITFVIDTVTMQQSYVGALFPYNHVSHSFNQFIKFDSDNLIYVDHGDAYPRSVVMQTHYNFMLNAPNDNYRSRPNVEEINLLNIKGNVGDNNTGTRVAGLELGLNHNIVAGTSIPHDTITGDINDYTTKNIYVSLVSKDGYSSELKWLTEYKEGSNISVTNFRFLKITDNQFALIYQMNKNDKKSIGFLLIDSNGEILKSKEFKGTFSGNVQPVVYQNSIIWLENIDNLDCYEEEEISKNYLVKIQLYN